MVGRALAFCFTEHEKIFSRIFFIPSRERLKKLKTIALRIHSDSFRSTRGSLITFRVCNETFFRKLVCLRRLKFKLLSVIAGELISERIEIDATRDTYMASRNLLVLRFTNRDVLQNPAGVFSEIAGVLKAAAATGNTPTPSLPARGREPRRRSPSPLSPLRGEVRGGGS